MAPEQAKGETVGPATDVYALGVILYELLAGQRPFNGHNDLDILRRACDQEPIAPTVLRRGLPRELEAICLRCLARQPQQRFPSAGALAGQLRNWLQQDAVRSSRPPRPRRRLALFCAGGAVLAALVTAVWLGAREHPAEDQVTEQALFAQRLKEGQPATWIGPTGSPPRVHWALGVGDPRERPDQVFEADAVLGLLEVVRRVRLEHFRFSAEVQHVRDLGKGMVGLYFGHRIEGDEHCYCALLFTDTRPIAVQPEKKKSEKKKLEQKKPEKERWKSVCRLSLVRRHAKRVPDLSMRMGTGHSFDPREGPPGRNGPWRRMGVEVTARGITTQWEGETETVPWAGYEREIKFARRGRASIAAPWPNLGTDYEPESGMGLFVAQARAAFRNVVVTPLP
jgi:serine/threonine-protein kinase